MSKRIKKEETPRYYYSMEKSQGQYVLVRAKVVDDLVTKIVKSDIDVYEIIIERVLQEIRRDLMGGLPENDK
jgi:hypothetical protein